MLYPHAFVVLLCVALLHLVEAHKIALRRHTFQSTTPPGRRTLSRRSVENDLLFSSSSILAPIQVGTPAQEVYVLLDTSSSDLALFGNGYADQFSSNDPDQQVARSTYKESSSSSYKATKNPQFQNNYGNGESSTFFVADYGQDTISFRGLTLVDQPLGVIQKGNVSYGPTAVGIMGLAFEAASLGLHATPPVQQLVFNNALKAPLFSFALMRPSAESEQKDKAGISQPGGIFTLGVLDGDQYQGNVGWSALVTANQASSNAPYKWTSKLDSISVNGQVVDGSQSIVANFDTGSSVSRASSHFLDVLFSNVQGAYKDEEGDYFVPCGQDVTPALNLTVSMGGVSVAIEPLDMLFKTTHFTTPDGASYCYSTLAVTDSEEYDIQVGDDILRSLFVAFSFNPPQIGLAAQSTNVHNQGAKPDYAFTMTTALDTSTLSQPQASGFSRVRSEDVPVSAVTAHIKSIGTTSIAVGGTYVATSTPSMQTVKASSTPAQIGVVETQAVTVNDVQGIERNPSTVTGNVSVSTISSASLRLTSFNVGHLFITTSVTLIALAFLL